MAIYVNPTCPFEVDGITAAIGAKYLIGLKLDRVFRALLRKSFSKSHQHTRLEWVSDDGGSVGAPNSSVPQSAIQSCSVIVAANLRLSISATDQYWHGTVRQDIDRLAAQ